MYNVNSNVLTTMSVQMVALCIMLTTLTVNVNSCIMLTTICNNTANVHVTVCIMLTVIVYMIEGRYSNITNVY